MKKVTKLIAISSVSIGLALTPMVSQAGIIMTGLATYGAIKVGQNVAEHYSENYKDKKDNPAVTKGANPVAHQQAPSTGDKMTPVGANHSQAQVTNTQQPQPNQVAKPMQQPQVVQQQTTLPLTSSAPEPPIPLFAPAAK